MIKMHMRFELIKFIENAFFRIWKYRQILWWKPCN